jgi:two-component system, LytTR family, response regulator
MKAMNFDKINAETEILEPCIKRELIARKCKGFEDILFCEAMGSYTLVHLKNEVSFMLCKRLKLVEDMLPKRAFARCHRSSLVNRNHIKNVIYQKQNRVVLTSGMKLTISERKNDEFIQWLGVK